MDNNVYTVVLGDTLYGVARRYNTSVQRLRELNSLNTDVIVPGQRLIVVGNDDIEPSECIIYTVKKGDNLYNIAIKYETTVDEIKRYNGLTSNNLSIGQKLTIPCFMSDDENDSLNYVSYVVESGDTLYKIANKFGTSVDKIKKDNNLTSNSLTIGTVLLIEDNTGVSSVEECFGESYDVPNNYTVYIVQRGDSLYSIARKFGTSVSEIENLNSLDNINLSIGQELKIPSNSNDDTTEKKYIVQKGESLYSIAKKFNTTVDALKSKNNLTSNLLSIGQELII